MAIRVINNMFVDNGHTAVVSAGIHAGMVVALSTGTDGLETLVKANRTDHTTNEILGLAADDAMATGNTMVVWNPVSLTPEAHPARRLGDYQVETGEIVANWTDSGTPKRGVAVYRYGGDFATDQYVSDASASGETADSGAAPSFAINDMWSYGASSTVNPGLLVDDGAQSIVIVAYLYAAATSGLMPFRWAL